MDKDVEIAQLKKRTEHFETVVRLNEQMADALNEINRVIQDAFRKMKEEAAAKSKQ